MTEDNNEYIDDQDTYIDVCLGIAKWQTPEGWYISEKDYRVKGEVWRVHKSDADPYPSKPHAHCIAGADRFIGCTLHLGTRELFKKRKKLGRLLEQKQFDRLIELIRPKFPDIKLPLNTTAGSKNA